MASSETIPATSNNAESDSLAIRPPDTESTTDCTSNVCPSAESKACLTACSTCSKLETARLYTAAIAVTNAQDLHCMTPPRQRLGSRVRCQPSDQTGRLAGADCVAKVIAERLYGTSNNIRFRRFLLLSEQFERSCQGESPI